MDIQEATSIIKCIPAIYRHRGYYDKDGKWFEGEGNLLTEKEITAIETILSELDKKEREIKELGESYDRLWKKYKEVLNNINFDQTKKLREMSKRITELEKENYELKIQNEWC